MRMRSSEICGIAHALNLNHHFSILRLQAVSVGVMAIKTAYPFINCIFFIKPGAIKTAYTFINCILLNQGLSKQHTPL